MQTKEKYYYDQKNLRMRISKYIKFQ